MASIKSQKFAAPQLMRVDGNGAVLTDKVVLGASPGLGTPASADTIDFPMPAGALLTELAFQLDDSDTGAAFVFGVGYRAKDPADATVLPTSAAYFAAAGQTTGQAGGRLTCNFKPIKFEVEAVIQLLVGTAPAGISGNPEIHMIAGYAQQGVK